MQIGARPFLRSTPFEQRRHAAALVGISGMFSRWNKLASVSADRLASLSGSGLVRLSSVVTAIS